MKAAQKQRENKKHKNKRFNKRELVEIVGSKSIAWRKYRKKIEFFHKNKVS